MRQLSCFCREGGLRGPASDGIGGVRITAVLTLEPISTNDELHDSQARGDFAHPLDSRAPIPSDFGVSSSLIQSGEQRLSCTPKGSVP